MDGFDGGQADGGYVGGGAEEQTAPIEQTPPVDQQPSENPAWSEYLTDIPEGYKGLVSDKFREWDSNVTKRFQEIHNQYEPLKAYQSFAQNSVDPEMLQAGLALFQRLQADPQAFYQQLGEHFGLTPQQAQEAMEEAEDEESQDRVVSDPRVDQIEQMQKQMYEMFQQQQQQEYYAQVEADTDAEINSFREAHPEVTDAQMSPIMRIAVMGVQQHGPKFSFEDAYRIFVQETNAHAQNRPGNNAPRVVSPNGQPSQPPQPKFEDLDEDQRRSLMVEDLKRAFQSN